MFFQPFDQEGLRVDPLVLSVDPNAHFNMQPCRFVRKDILISLRGLIDQFVSEGVLVPDSNFSHASPLVIVPKKRGWCASWQVGIRQVVVLYYRWGAISLQNVSPEGCVYLRTSV